MNPTLESQIAVAQADYDASFARHPKSAWTTRLWYNLRELKMKKLKAECEAA